MKQREIIKHPIRTYVHKGVTGRSLTSNLQLKIEYLEFRKRDYQKFGIDIEEEDIVLQDFGIWIGKYWTMSVTNDMITYVYKMRGKYNNGVRL